MTERRSSMKTLGLVRSRSTLQDPCYSRPWVPICTRGSVNGEMLDGGLSVNEKSLILGIEDGPIDVVPSERSDRLTSIPEADRHKLGTVTVRFTDQIRALVPRRCLVLDDAGAENVLGVGIRVLGASPTSPVRTITVPSR